ncbi:MAG: hypothetical protein ACK2UI_03115, partial [Anaerolineae bacterium]
CVGWLFSLAGFLLSLYAGFLAIQEGLDLDTGETIATILIGGIVAFIVSLVIGLIFGVGLVGFSALGNLFRG